MRTANVKVYSYAELSDKAKAKVREDLLESGYPEWNWASDVVEGLYGGGGTDDLHLFGLFPARENQPKRQFPDWAINWEIDWSHGRPWATLPGVTVEDPAQFCEAMQFTRGLRNAVLSGAVSINFTDSGGYWYQQGRAVSRIEFERTDGFSLSASFRKQADSAEEWWQEYLQHVADLVEQEYEGICSEEDIADMAHANEWEFTEDGEFWTGDGPEVKEVTECSTTS